MTCITSGHLNLSRQHLSASCGLLNAIDKWGLDFDRYAIAQKIPYLTILPGPLFTIYTSFAELGPNPPSGNSHCD
jgi:hypothetical protein